MNAVEFSGKIEGGLIRLPLQYSGYDNAFVRVILLVEEPVSGLSKKERLLAAIRKMENKNMFSKIDNPVDWQKKQRDEWE